MRKVDARSDEVMRSLQQQMYFVSGEMDDPAACPARERLEQVGAEGVLYYLAIPPTVYGPVVEALGAAGLAGTPEKGWRRVIVEKPFGTDLRSAQALNALLHEHFAEEQIFRIDHYLGKETVQNLLALRFANGMFEPIWNRRYIEQVQITAAETVGVERRAAYYEKAGALRDMVQNHLMQLLSLVAMEPPTEFNAAACAIGRWTRCSRSSPWSATVGHPAVVRAQYREGWVNGAEVPGIDSSRASAPTRRRRPSSRCGSISTAGAGRECRSICAPGNGCRSE